MTNRPSLAKFSVDQKLKDELLCIADSKLVLAGWYMIVLPNGRAIADWSAICAMLQAQYGHARAIYQYLGQFGVTREQAEWTRGAADIRSLKMLDKPPLSWADFIVSVFLAEQSIMTLLGAYRDGEADRTLARLAGKVNRESHFHRSYMVGWIKALRKDASSAVNEYARSRIVDALDWWGEGVDDVLCDAGYRDASEKELRERFIKSASDVFDFEQSKFPSLSMANGGHWKRDIRRAGDGGIPPALFELIRFKNIELALP